MSEPMEFVWSEEQHAFQLKGCRIFVRTVDTIEWEDEMRELEEEVENEELEEGSAEYREKLAGIEVVEVSDEFRGGLVYSWRGATPEMAIAQMRDFDERRWGNA